MINPHRETSLCFEDENLIKGLCRDMTALVMAKLLPRIRTGEGNMGYLKGQ